MTHFDEGRGGACPGHWRKIPAEERQARLRALREQGLELPVHLIARTMERLGLLADADAASVLDDPRVCLFLSKARVLGRISHETATIQLKHRTEDVAPGDLIVVELTKDGPPRVAAPLLVRRIDAPAVRGALWMPDAHPLPQTLSLLSDATAQLEGGGPQPPLSERSLACRLLGWAAPSLCPPP